jgi:hypothetical protein
MTLSHLTQENPKRSLIFLPKELQEVRERSVKHRIK